jgi:hypothetical protein
MVCVRNRLSILQQHLPLLPFQESSDLDSCPAHSADCIPHKGGPAPHCSHRNRADDDEKKVYLLFYKIGDAIVVSRESFISIATRKEPNELFKFRLFIL